MSQQEPRVEVSSGLNARHAELFHEPVNEGYDYAERFVLFPYLTPTGSVNEGRDPRNMEPPPLRRDGKRPRESSFQRAFNAIEEAAPPVPSPVPSPPPTP